jgi:hypothetical protein
MASDRIKVLYVAGWGRSGSTVLSAILGQLDGFFSAGEVHQIWNNGLLDNEPCGCGTLFSECQVWQAVFEEAYGGFGQINPNRMIQCQDQNVRIRKIPRMALSRLKTSFPRDYIDSLDNLYTAIHKVTRSRVIVDSSKDSVYGQVLECLPSIDVYVLHLVRDPRAVAFSWQRKKHKIPGYHKLFSQKSPVQSSLKWFLVNWSIQTLQRRTKQMYMRIRYEDVISQPSTVVANILRFVGEESSNLPFQNGRELELDVNHMIAGNPMRFQRGKLELLPDIEWMSRLRKRDKVLVTLLTWPMLIKYKYWDNR